MKRLLITLIILLPCTFRLLSQNVEYQYLIHKGREAVPATGTKFYAGLTHQHQEFFDTPFSLTGIETGVIRNQRFIVGVYGSTFLSNLEIEDSNTKTYYTSAQLGVVTGAMYHSYKWLHPGMLINLGYFSVTGSPSHFNLFDPQNTTVDIHGMVFTPQAFAGIIP